MQTHAVGTAWEGPAPGGAVQPTATSRPPTLATPVITPGPEPAGDVTTAGVHAEAPSVDQAAGPRSNPLPDPPLGLPGPLPTATRPPRGLSVSPYTALPGAASAVSGPPVSLATVEDLAADPAGPVEPALPGPEDCGADVDDDECPVAANTAARIAASTTSAISPPTAATRLLWLR